MGLSKYDKRSFYFQLDVLVTAGVALEKAVEMTVGYKSTARVEKVMGSLKNAIEEGSSLSEFMESRPKDFSPYECNIIESGERNGNLQDSLQWLSQLYSMLLIAMMHEGSEHRYMVPLIFGGILVILLSLIYWDFYFLDLL